MSSSTGIEVNLICLFDSPFRKPSIATNNLNMKEIDGYNNTGNVLVDRHFKKCVELLDVYHRRSFEDKPSLSCPVFDIRPLETQYIHNITTIEELTSGKVQRQEVSGNHWTMMFTNNADTVASFVLNFMKSNL